MTAEDFHRRFHISYNNRFGFKKCYLPPSHLEIRRQRMFKQLPLF